MLSDKHGYLVEFTSALNQGIKASEDVDVAMAESKGVFQEVLESIQRKVHPAIETSFACGSSFLGVDDTSFLNYDKDGFTDFEEYSVYVNTVKLEESLEREQIKRTLFKVRFHMSGFPVEISTYNNRYECSTVEELIGNLKSILSSATTGRKLRAIEQYIIKLSADK